MSFSSALLFHTLPPFPTSPARPSMFLVARKSWCRAGASWKRSVQTSANRRATREREVIESVGKVIEPFSRETLNNIAAIQSVKVDEGHVYVDLDFFVPGYPKAVEMKQSCEEVIKRDIPWITDISLSINQGSFTGTNDLNSTTSNINFNSSTSSAPSLRQVQHIIGVSSCKGGVGKSTTAVNLASTLAKRGLMVGLLDADVYGPSLPSLLSPDQLPIVIRKDPEDPQARSVLPLITAVGEMGGMIKFLSFGHVNPKAGVAGAGGEGAAVLRGPIVSRVINQLIANTAWGALDYLIVDMPPGTGDIQITLNQSMSMTGSVIVTTPHPLATVDVLKGHQMMRAMHVPTLALVENMSHFTCDLGTRYYPFGRLDKAQLQQQMSCVGGEGRGKETHSVPADGIIPIVSFPLTSAISQRAPGEDSHHVRPVVLASSEQSSSEHVRDVVQCYEELADAVIGGIFKVQLGAQMLPQLTYNKAKQSVILRYYTASEAIEYVIPVAELRLRDAATGLPLPPNTVSSSLRSSILQGTVYPTAFDSKGNYGVSIVWSDGHFADIYTFSVLKSIAQDSS